MIMQEWTIALVWIEEGDNVDFLLVPRKTSVYLMVRTMKGSEDKHW